MQELLKLNYELWQEPDGLAFFASTNEAARNLLDPSSTLIWQCNASSFENAQEQKHAFLGWAPYEHFGN